MRFHHESKDANASTLRSVVGLKSAEVLGFKGHFELEDISEIGPDNFNNTINGVEDRPVVADVEGTEVNILTLSSLHIPDSEALVGRYHKVLDNARFIGDVAWRQNFQTYDGATFTNSSVEDLDFFYGYMWNVNRIFGDDSPVGDIDSSNNIFHLKYSGIPGASASAYAYLLDLEDLADVASTTYGALINGKYELNEDLNLLYDGEYAYQSDYGDNPTNYDANYFRIGAGLEHGWFSISGGFESLGSDSGNIGFSTPLATLHMWNGFADLFLDTPAEGLRDAYGQIAFKHEAWNEHLGSTSLRVIYHSFESETGGIDYGTEWDADLVQNFLDRYYFGVRFAHYEADEFGRDTTKLIFSLGAEFSSTSL